MSLTSGTKLGPYEIVSPLGAGGMGEVYRARDSKLNREVALKVLPAAMASDAERMARFQREAQVLASLNHPNIASIYGLEDSVGVRALVMELVEGPTLAERIAVGAPGMRPPGETGTGESISGSAGARRSPLQIDETLEIARQIAEALEAAHERGIIHRDLKPANIKITDEGVVKVLDFGLAKAVVSEDASSGISNSPTISFAATQAGMILGTATYMSPEQAKGKKVDRRADIWAFGCVLFEMLTGKKTFEGETTSEVLAAVICAEPDWNAVPPSTPAPIRKLLQRCLQKDPKQRLRDIGEARITIEETRSGGAESAVAISDNSPEGRARRALVPQPLWRRTLPWAVAAISVIVALVATELLQHARHRVVRMQFAIPVSSEVSHLALSLDGKLLAYVANDELSGENMLFVQPVGSSAPTKLPGTEGAYYPFWSPDDAWVAFFAGGKLKKSPVAGGPPQILANSTFGRGGSWGSRGVIIYTPDAGGGLWRVNADGTNAAALSAALLSAGDFSERWPLFLPDGDHFIFLTLNIRTGNEGVNMGLYVSSITAQQKTFLVSAQSSAGYADGQVFYLNDKRELIALQVDATAGKVLGEPHLVANAVDYQPATYYASFGVANNGTIVFNFNGSSSLSTLTWFDRSGKELGRVGEPGVMANPAISPDGKRALVDITDQKANIVNIWMEDFDRKTSSRFTFDSVESVVGTWSRDESTVAYRAVGVTTEIRLRKSTGLEQWKRLFTPVGQDDIIPNSWMLDDRQILCTAQPAAGGSHLVLIDAASGKETPFLTGQAMETNGQISPDSKWVAYASNESGDWEIYVTTFPNPVGKWQVSRDGGTEPRWNPDGKEVFYISSKGVLTAVKVGSESTFSPGTPVALFPIGGRAPISSTDLFTYDVARDGNRFLINRFFKPDYVPPLTVVLNATAETKK